MMALRSAISSKIPMVVILGATGTGKTKLGVELAQKFGTEIISADSMQIYKGLDLVTAKATLAEREAVTHHLLDILEPDQIFTVVDFRNRALKIIDNLTEQGKIPIVVGGTNYYMESIVYQILVEDMGDPEKLLWNKSRRKRELIDDDGQNGGASVSKKSCSELDISKESSASNVVESVTEKIDFNDERAKEKLKEDYDNESKFTNEEIHEKLKALDPVMAARLHPNNRRKILRSIEVWLKSGRLHSELLAEQKLSENQLRRPGATILLWLRCEQSVLDERLNRRVDAMLEEGLIEELLDFHERHNKQRIKDGTPPDYTKGIFQTLGFKEFHEYLMLTDEQRNSEEGKKLLEECMEKMRGATQRYARRQNKMTRRRFIEHGLREIPDVYELDTTDLNKWDEDVKNKAIEIIESYLEGQACRFQKLTKSIIQEEKDDGNSYNFCDVCERIIMGDKSYQDHLQSNRHMKVVKHKTKLQEKQNKDTQ